MALAVAANVGGTITMVGTPPNILMSATLQATGLEPFGFFEFALYWCTFIYKLVWFIC